MLQQSVTNNVDREKYFIMKRENFYIEQQRFPFVNIIWGSISSLEQFALQVKLGWWASWSFNVFRCHFACYPDSDAVTAADIFSGEATDGAASRKAIVSTTSQNC